MRKPVFKGPIEFNRSVGPFFVFNPYPWAESAAKPQRGNMALEFFVESLDGLDESVRGVKI